MTSVTKLKIALNDTFICYVLYTSNMYIAILGRQPPLGMAELERIYGDKHVRWFSDCTATISVETFDFERLGGSQKAGRVRLELSGDWQRISRQIVTNYS